MKVLDKYPLMPKSIISLPRNNKERLLRKGRKKGKGDTYFTESSRSKLSYFDETLCEFILKYYARDCKRIFDPFAGWGERHFKSKELGYNYTGVDVSQKAIDFAKDVFNVTNILGDSSSTIFSDNSFDFCFSCPPYYNLEKYESCKGQLTDAKQYIHFLFGITHVIREIRRVTKPKSLTAFVIGDFRRRGIFYPFTIDMFNIFRKESFHPFDCVIIDKAANYRLPMFLGQADRLGYTVKIHEYLWVFSNNKKEKNETNKTKL